MSRLHSALLDTTYITVPEMAAESGQRLSVVYFWLRYHHYLNFERVDGRVVARRDEWETFKEVYPELMNGDTQ